MSRDASCHLEVYTSGTSRIRDVSISVNSVCIDSLVVVSFAFISNISHDVYLQIQAPYMFSVTEIHHSSTISLKRLLYGGRYTSDLLPHVGPKRSI